VHRANRGAGRIRCGPPERGTLIATLAVAVEADRVTRLAVAPPLAAKLAPPGPDGPALWLVSSAASVLEGDVLRVEVDLGPGARLAVRSVAAQLVHPCPGGGWGAIEVVARLGAGAHLDWAPEPVVVAGGGRYRGRADVALGPGAGVSWTDELVLGRSGDDPATVEVDTALRIDREGRPVLRDGLASGPAWRGPAVLGDATYAGAIHAIGGPAPADADRPGWWPLHAEGLTTRVLARDVVAGRAELAARRATVTPAR
jgi:urease accessory protein